MAAFGIQLIQALQSLKMANETVKYLRSVEANFDKAELKVKYAELADTIADTRESLLDAKEENESLQARIKELEAARDIRSRIVKRGNVYFIREESGESGPICVRCYEADHKQMPLTALPRDFRDLAQYRCPDCEAVY